MNGWVTIPIIGRLLIPRMRGMSTCMLWSFREGWTVVRNLFIPLILPFLPVKNRSYVCNWYLVDYRKETAESLWAVVTEWSTTWSTGKVGYFMVADVQRNVFIHPAWTYTKGYCIHVGYLPKQSSQQLYCPLHWFENGCGNPLCYSTIMTSVRLIVAINKGRGASCSNCTIAKFWPFKFGVHYHTCAFFVLCALGAYIGQYLRNSNIDVLTLLAPLYTNLKSRLFMKCTSIKLIVLQVGLFGHSCYTVRPTVVQCMRTRKHAYNGM